MTPCDDHPFNEDIPDDLFLKKMKQNNISPSAVHAELEKLKKTCAIQREINAELRNERTARINQEQTIKMLKQEIDFYIKENKQLKLRVELLKGTLAKVSEAELARIKKEYSLMEQKRIEEAINKKAERYVVECSCRGYDKDCERCHGWGNFAVDGSFYKINSEGPLEDDDYILGSMVKVVPNNI